MSGLLLYRDIGSSTYVAYNPSDDASPSYIETSHDCELGEVQETQLFLRNDDILYYYTNISIEAESLISPNDVVGTETGWGVKFSAGSTQPTEAQWHAVDYGNKISMADLGSSGSPDTSTYLPFWIRIECPAGIAPTVKENIAINIFYKETLA